MKKNLSNALVAVISGLGAWTGSVSAAAPAVVFDNTPNLINSTPEFFTGREYGDELNLAGTERTVTDFRFAYFGNFGATANVSYNIRFYANDGSDAVAGSATALRPGTQLWDSGAQSIQNGVNIVDLAIPGVVVPDRFTWSVTFNGLDGNVGRQAALMRANPGVIGAPLPGGNGLPDLIGSYEDFWLKSTPGDSESWGLFNFGFGPSDPKGNFYARVVATPEPGTWALAFTGTGLIVLARRRSTR